MYVNRLIRILAEIVRRHRRITDGTLIPSADHHRQNIARGLDLLLITDTLDEDAARRIGDELAAAYGVDG